MFLDITLSIFSTNELLILRLTYANGKYTYALLKKSEIFGERILEHFSARSDEDAIELGKNLARVYGYS